VVVGPCSVHDVDAALEYARRLSERVPDLKNDLVIVMRVYFEKPRTTVGWKGLINDPHLDGSGDVNTGLRLARQLLLEVCDLGLPVGCEFLDPITPQYIADVVAWGAIGARTTESQTHRQLASGLSMPIGFKNGTDGNVKIAVDAVRAAAASHVFAGVDISGTPEEAVRGVAAEHVQAERAVERGRHDDVDGPADVAAALEQLRAAGLAERLVLDASHDNSGKDHLRQAEVVADIASEIAAGNRAINGVMMESFLVAGAQKQEPGRELVYGQSITDACMDWDATAVALDRLAEAVRERRSAA